MRPRRSTDLRRDHENPASGPDAAFAELTRRSFLLTTVRSAVTAALTMSPAAREVAAQHPAPENAFPHIEKAEQGEVLARKRIDEYLHKNAERAEELDDMFDTIEQFRRLAPNIVVIKCMDERLQGPLGKGCPETIIVFLRSDGSRVFVEADNDLKLLINQAMMKESSRDNPMPVIVLVIGHTECAAHKKQKDEPTTTTDERTLLTIRDELRALNKMPRLNGANIFIAAMTDTANLGLTLYPPDGKDFFNAQAVIETFKMTKPAEIFDTDFLQHTVENTAHECIRGQTIGQLFGGSEPAAFIDHRKTIAIETYLLQKITTAVQNGTLQMSPILSEHIQRKIDEGLANTDTKSSLNFPESLRGFMTYMLAWNTAYALYRNQYLDHLRTTNPAAYENATKHSGLIACHGRGFDTNKAQDGLVIRPSSGEDNRAMGTARNVMAEVYTRLQPGHVPIVHINIELPYLLETDEQLSEVRGRMMSKIDVDTPEFGNDVYFLTTYSYHHSLRDKLRDEKTGRRTLTKQYLPLNPNPIDKRIICPNNLLEKTITPKATLEFKADELRQRESDYSKQSLLKKAA